MNDLYGIKGLGPESQKLGQRSVIYGKLTTRYLI